MNCPKCGKLNPDKYNYCKYCGTPLRGSEPKTTMPKESTGRQGPDWNARFQEGQTLYQAGKYGEAGDIFEEVAEGTSDPAAIRATIAVKKFLAISDIGMIEQGFPVSEFSLEAVTSALRWIDIAERRPEFQGEMEKLLGDHKECQAIKGKILFLLQGEEAESALIDAVERGDNPSRFLLALYYKDVGGKLVDAGDESKIDIIKACYRNMTVLFEEYIANYDPEEAESDEYKTACNICASVYENGMGVEPDLEKARRYSYLASTFNG